MKKNNNNSVETENIPETTENVTETKETAPENIENEPKFSELSDNIGDNQSKKNWSWKKTLLVLIGVLFLLLLILYGFIHSLFAGMREDSDAIFKQNESLEYEDVVAANEDHVAEMEAAVAGLEEMDAVEATGEVMEDDDVLNILLIGSDERTGKYTDKARGDSIILASINTTNKKPVISLVSFQRGIGVPILEGKYKGQYDWLTHTFRYGGAELLMKEVRECFKVDVDYYVRVNFDAFEAGIDAIGGVDVYMDEAEVTYFIDGHVKEDVTVGMNHFDGRTALAYARLREIDSDWMRIQRQREVITSALEQAKEMSLPALHQLLNTMLPLVKTNLTESEITEIFLLFPQLNYIEVQQMTIPQSGTYGSMKGMGGRSLYAVDFETNAEILHDFLYNIDESEESPPD